MLKFLADENFNNRILRGLFERHPEIDLQRAQDVGLSGIDDPTVLEWCAQESRILLTHDFKTITKYAYERVAEGLYMPGVFEVFQHVPIVDVIDEILLLNECSNSSEWENQVQFIPLK